MKKVLLSSIALLCLGIPLLTTARSPQGTQTSTQLGVVAVSENPSIFNNNIVDLAQQNTSYRKVLFTSPLSQVVLMDIPPKTEIGSVVHTLTKSSFLYKEKGR